MRVTRHRSPERGDFENGMGAQLLVSALDGAENSAARPMHAAMVERKGRSQPNQTVLIYFPGARRALVLAIPARLFSVCSTSCLSRWT